MGFFNKLKELKYREEISLVEELIQNNAWINESNIERNAAQIVHNCRDDRKKTRLDNFFLEYGLSNQEE